MVTWKELEGKRLLGVMPDKDDSSAVFIFTESGDYRAWSKNQDYSYFDNYILEASTPPARDDTYKAIGEVIKEVWADGEDINTDYIGADHEKWVAAVGDGSWGPTEGEPYTFITLKTASKRVDFTTIYHDCHYPETLWDVQ